MIARDVKLFISGAEDVEIKREGKDPVKCVMGNVGGDVFDKTTRLSLSRKVTDGIYLCGISVEFDFNTKKNKVKIMVGDACGK